MIHLMNKKKLIPCFLLLTTLLVGDIYEEAVKLESEGKKSEALVLYTEWLDKASSYERVDIADLILHGASLCHSPGGSLTFLQKYVRFLSKGEDRKKIYIKIASIYELLGSVKQAGIHLEKAAYSVKGEVDYSLLISSGELLMETGNIRGVYTLMEKIQKESPEHRTRAQMVMARALYYMGEQKKALSLLKNLPESSETLYLKGIIEGGSDSFRTLNKQYANTMENSLITGETEVLNTPLDYVHASSLISLPSGKVSHTPASEEKEYSVGFFSSREAAGGTMNILENQGFKWQLKENSEGFSLCVSVSDPEDLKRLKKLGLNPLLTQSFK